ncbi:MAG: DnaJ domain-containing protein [Proteobacteria bacterium]|nr:DnaJ domain-containing protein [Pseudomonadota bacterium]
MNTRQTLQPSAKGTFAKTPFAHILVYLYSKKKIGILDVRDKNDSITVFFRDGTPAKVRSSISGRSLGRVLLLLKLITEEQLAECEEEINRNGGFQGEVLVRQGAINTQTLVRGLREQMLLKLTDIFASTGASYAFYENVNTLSRFGPDELFPLDPYPLLMAGLRAYSNRQNIDPVCDLLKDKWLSSKDVEVIRRFRLNREEKALLREMLVAPQSYNDLLTDGRHDPNIVKYSLYVLAIAKLLEISDSAPEVVSPPIAQDQASALDSVRPDPRRDSEDPEVSERRRSIEAKAVAIASQNYYEMLDVPFGAPAEVVRKAYFQLAKEFHPDKVPTALASEIKETLQYIFSSLSEAHATLIDPDAREEYEAAILEGELRTSIAPLTDDETEVRNTLRAENEYQKALVFMRRGQMEKAEERIDIARQLNPTEGEYLAVWAFLELKRRPQGESLEDLADALRKALTTNPKSERAHLYFAYVLKAMGRNAEAKTHFEKVISFNSHNIDAGRELRLMTMRRQSWVGKKSRGLFSRLFKGKS